MPNVVRGSRQDKMMVVPYRPGQRLFWFFGSILLISLGTLCGFGFGYYQIHKVEESFKTGFLEQIILLDELIAENSELKRQVAMLERSGLIDQRVNETDQKTINSLRDQLATLEQDLSFYKNIITEQTDDTGLMVSEWSLKRISKSNRYRYKLALRQEDADGDTYLNGHVNVNLVGTQNGKDTVYSLSDVSKEQEQTDIKLRFKFFQDIEGELTLPDNFLPQYVKIVGVENNPVRKTINLDYSWIDAKGRIIEN